MGLKLRRMLFQANSYRYKDFHAVCIKTNDEYSYVLLRVYTFQIFYVDKIVDDFPYIHRKCKKERRYILAPEDIDWMSQKGIQIPMPMTSKEFHEYFKRI
jgi:hypothetical protein